jgi:hypothetical protein
MKGCFGSNPRGGHASVQTTQRYLGCKQNLAHSVNDLFTLGTKPTPPEPGAQTPTSTSLATTLSQGLECPRVGSEHGDPASFSN